jgi:thiamine-phosphate pyrophosphorylase
MGDNLSRLLRLMLVTDDRLLRGRDLVALAEAAVRGGVTSVQLRLKQAGPRELLHLAGRLLDRLSVPLIVNDRADVAAAAGVGVHLGADDLPVALVRSILPAGALIGASVGVPAEAPNGASASYWGVGPWRQTGTKGDAGVPLGIEGFRRIRELAGGIPCVAIGGIRPEDLPAVRAAGAVGVAVSSGLLQAARIEEAAARYAEAWSAG